MSERASRCLEDKGSFHTASATLEVLDLDGGQQGSGIMIHLNMEEKPSLPRGEGEADSDAPASG